MKSFELNWGEIGENIVQLYKCYSVAGEGWWRVAVRIMFLGFLICYNSPGEKCLSQDRRRRSREEEEIPVWEPTELGSSACVG